MTRILVTGATGNVGGAVVQQLAGAEIPVLAMTRNPASTSLPAGVEIVRGDLADPASLEAPLEGVDAVFLVWLAPAEAIQPAMDRIVRRARRVVYLSAPLKTPHPLFQQPNRARDIAMAVEAAIEASGLEWTFLRPGMFARNAVEWWAPQIRAGNVVRWPYMDVPTAPIHQQDIAEVAVQALLRDGHAGAEYVLAGPESLTHRDQIETIARVLGRDLSIEEVPPADAHRYLATRFPAPVANMLANAWAAAAGHPAWMTSTFAELTGRPARPFAQWVAENAAEFEAYSSTTSS